jgi:hypothetical protein
MLFEPGHVVQRMILPVWGSKKDKKDFLEQGEKQKTLLGHGTVINIGNWFTDKDLKGIGLSEDLHIIGHGNPATVAGMSPEVLADFIVNTLGLPAKYNGTVFLETCHSGSEIAELEGSYAERFMHTLAKLRPDSEPLDFMSFDGPVVLDDTYQGHEMLRIMTRGSDIGDFKKIAVQAMETARLEVGELLKVLKAEDLGMFLNEREIQNLLFHIYNSLIYKIGEPVGGKRTRFIHEGKVYEGIPDTLPNIKKLKEQIVSQARKSKEEIDSIEIKELVL